VLSLSLGLSSALSLSAGARVAAVCMAVSRDEKSARHRPGSGHYLGLEVRSDRGIIHE